MSLSAEVTATDERKKRSRPNQDIDDMTPFYAVSDVRSLQELALPAVAKVDVMVSRCVPSLHVRY